MGVLGRDAVNCDSVDAEGGEVEGEVLAAIGRYYDGTSVNFSATFVLAGATK